MGTNCQSTYLNAIPGYLPWEVLSKATQNAIKTYTGLQFNANDSVCHHHSKEFGKDLKRTSGPCVVHKSEGQSAKGQLVTLATYLDCLAGKHHLVYPGIYICKACKSKLKTGDSTSSVVGVDRNGAQHRAKRKRTQSTDYDPNVEDRRDENEDESPLINFNMILEAANVDNVIRNRMNRDQLKTAVITKLKTLILNCIEILSELNLNLRMTDIISEGANLDERSALSNIFEETATAFAKSSDYREKIQLLTIFPPSVPRQYIVKTLSAQGAICSLKMIVKSRKLRKQRGILAKPEKRRGNPIRDADKCLVQNYYNDDCSSYQMPGLKDVVLAKVDGKKIPLAKRIVLDNLSEIYRGFKRSYPHIKIGFAKFATLRPKHCILSTSKGSHNVCVCQSHSNAHLLVDAIKKPKEYLKFLISVLVCNSQDSHCMFGDCERCIANKLKRKEMFVVQIQQAITEANICEEISFSQWISKPRVTLNRQIREINDYCEYFYNIVCKIIPHHFIASTQSRYFKILKSAENIGDATAIVQLDFGENFCPVIQNATQSFHWENNQTTIHPFVVYRKLNGLVDVKSYVAISDELEHNVRSVYAFISVLMQHFQLNYPHITHIEYFSDGCGGQYKNYKMFGNLLAHENDFGNSASWNFFATSHGKGAVDGVSAVVKHQARRYNIQNKTSPILTAKNLFDFVREKVSGIHAFYVPKEEISRIAAERNLEARFEVLHTIPRTRSAHKVIAKDGCLYLYKTGECEQPFHVERRCENFKTTSDLEYEFPYKVCDFVAAMYDTNWYVGQVKDIDEETECCLVQFFKNPGTERSFTWPVNVEHNTCWVPTTSILIHVTPKRVGSRREIYSLPPAQRLEVEKLFQRFSMDGKNKKCN